MGTHLALAVTAWAGAWSLATFALMVRDKRAARSSRRRARESRLLLLALVGGAWGAWAGMSLARHKTRHLRFRLVVPVATAAWTTLIVLVWLRVPFGS